MKRFVAPAVALTALVSTALPAWGDDGSYDLPPAQQATVEPLREVMPGTGVWLVETEAVAVQAYLAYLYDQEPVEVIPGVFVPRHDVQAVLAYLTAMHLQATPARDDVVEAYRPVMDCIAHGESGGSYVAKNPRSSAAGRYQWLSSSWRNAAVHAGMSQWAGSSAMHVPPEVQDYVTAVYIRDFGIGAWSASAANRRCGALLPG